MLGWLFLLALLAALTGLIVYRWAYGRKQPGYLAFTEYWVYGAGTQLPPQDKLMDRMISSNPHNRRGQPCIGAREGMLFTDIRLHMAVVLREKNATLFRPDLFAAEVAPTAEILKALPDAKALVKVRYASEAPLKDFRHLQFLPHLTDSVAEMMDGTVVFDTVAERLWLAAEFREMLAKNGQCERPEFHVRARWVNQDDECYARTHGMPKIGWPELRTDPQEQDNEVLVTGLLMRLAFHLFRRPEETGPWEFEEFGDTFIFELQPRQDELRVVSLKRRQVVG